MFTQGMRTSARDDWETPSNFFADLNAEFHFTLDVCATAKNKKCRNFFSRMKNGLAQQWRGTCWMNPPYGRAIGNWMKKAYEESQRGVTVVCLVPARTDTAWWHDYAMKGEIRFLRGRLYFSGGRRAPFPSAVVIFRPKGAPNV